MSYVRLHASLARVVLSRFPFLCLYWSNTVCNFSFLRSVYICAHVSFLRMFSAKKCCPRVFFTASRFDMVHLYKVSSINKYIDCLYVTTLTFRCARKKTGVDNTSSQKGNMRTNRYATRAKLVRVKLTFAETK